MNGDFSAQRNFTKSQSSGTFIFMLDPDELPSRTLLMRLPDILTQMEREGLDGCIVPRFNKLIEANESIDPRTIYISDEDLSKAPAEDMLRIYRNSPDITWANPLHEKLIGVHRVLRLPSTIAYAILHIKTKQKAASQVSFYNSLGSTAANIGIDIKFRIIKMLRRLRLLSVVQRTIRPQLVEIDFQE